MSACGLVLSVFVILKLPFLPNCFNLTSQFSTFLRDPLASGLGTKWCWLHYEHKMQFSVLSVFCATSMCLWLHVT